MEIKIDDIINDKYFLINFSNNQLKTLIKKEKDLNLKWILQFELNQRLELLGEMTTKPKNKNIFK